MVVDVGFHEVSGKVEVFRTRDRPHRLPFGGLSGLSLHIPSRPFPRSPRLF